MQPRLRTTVLGVSDSQQSQLKKLAEGLFCVTVCNVYAERAWEQCHSSGGNTDP